MSHHENETRDRNQATEAKEVDAMYEPSNEERELERLFAADLEIEGLAEPPVDLADRIKAEIPADLGWSSADSADNTEDEGGVEVPFWRHPRTLALAATLTLAAGLAFLMRHDLAPSSSKEGLAESPTDRQTIGSEAPAEATAEVTAEADPEVPGPARQLPASEDQSHDRFEDQAEAGVKKRQDEIRSRRELLQAQLGRMRGDAGSGTVDDRDTDGAASNAARSRRVPMPDPTPGEPEAVAEMDAPELEESQFAIPEPMPSAPEPPPPPMHVRRVPPQASSAPAPKPASGARGEADAESRRLGQSAETSVSYNVSVEEMESKLQELEKQMQPTQAGKAPNDEAYDAMFFESAGVNPFVDTEDDALSTFGLDVDTASYTVARRYLQDGHLPPRDAVRVEEMLNYFDYGDAPPSAGSRDDFALHADVAPSRWAPDGNRSERYYLVRFGLRARDVLEAERSPALLTFVVDVSGSMSREDRLGLVKRSLGLLLEHLRDDDRVALVVYGSQGRVLMEPTSDKDVMRRAIERLVPEGSTNAAEGLRLGYELTARHRRPGDIHRVILCSDGVANVGSTTSGEGILSEVERWGKQGVELTTVGFGMGNYNDVLMETLADQGNGRYAYVDTLDEARRIFVDDLTGTLTTVAAEARVQVAFDPEVVSRYRLLGYENRDIADERFRDDTVDAGEIGAGHAVTALYEVKTHEPLRGRDRLATLTMRYASIARGEMVEQSRPVTGRDASRSFQQAPQALRLAATVAEFAEVLRGSYWARDVDLAEVFDEARSVAADWQGDSEEAAELLDFASLVAKAQTLREQLEER